MDVNFYTPVAALAGGSGSPPPAGATLSETDKSSGIALSNADMTASNTLGSVDLSGFGSLAITAGQKVRFEFRVDTNIDHVAFGLGNASTNFDTYLGSDANNGGYYSDGNSLLIDNNTVASYATYDVNDIIDVDVDFDAGTAEWFLNGASQGSPVSHGIVGDLFPAYCLKGIGSSATLIAPANFTYAPPSGFTKYGA